MQSLARLLLVCASLLLGPLAVMADELPKDTNKITSLTVEQARRLVAEFKGFVLGLDGLTTLDADTAKALAAIEKWYGQLSALTAFESPDSIAVAKALAKRTLPLPNLKKISPKTLSALIEKRDVEIPLVETLELIQEPDGSVTEDFLIPEWLEDRQNQQRAEQRAK